MSVFNSLYTIEAPGVSGLPEMARARIRAEQFHSVVRYTPLTMVANVCNAVILVIALRGTEHEWSSLIWTFALCSFAAYQYLRGVAIRAAPKSMHVSARGIRRTIVFSGILGVMWGVAPALFFRHIDMSATLVVICMCCGMLCGGALVLASLPAAAIAYMAPVLIGSVVAIAHTDIPSQPYLVALFIIFTYVLALATISHTRQLATRLVKQIAAEDAARQDALTNLPNVLSYRERLEQALGRVKNYGEQAAVIYVDLDGFKPVNDRYGHSAGDEILIQVAGRLSASIRRSDIVARLGGDEFAIVLAGVSGPVDVMACAERIARSFSTPFVAAGLAQQVGVSMGIAIAPSDGLDPTTLLEKADYALYQAKSAGGNICRFFDAAHALAVKERRDLEADLRDAVEKRQLHLVFQPIIDIAGGHVIGCEALARWDHPTRGEIPPTDFIPMAERTGLIQEIGAWIIEDSCRVARRLPEEMRVSVNVSVAQLRGEALLATLSECVARAGIGPNQIEIEITESLLITRDDPAIDVAHRVANAGFPIALDDFGTGYASLNYLRKLPLQRVKIDREFIHDSLTHADCAAIVSSVIHLARTLDLQVTAEGVETEEQLAFLRLVGCGAAQGFLISKPLLEPDLLDLVAVRGVKRIAA